MLYLLYFSFCFNAGLTPCRLAHYSQTDLRDLDGVDRQKGINEVQLGWRILPPMETHATSPRRVREGSSEERQESTASSLKR